MPLVRCKFYTESGEPLNRGCRKGMGCRFIHPDDPRWREARAPPFRPTDKGGNLAGFKPGGDRAKPPASTGWDLGKISSTSGSSSLDTGGGWDTGEGWNAGASTSAPPTNQSSGSWNSSGWGEPGWGESSLPRNDGWGAKGAWGESASSRNPWGDNAWGSGGWGDGAGTAEEKKDSIHASGAPEPMDVDQKEEPTTLNKGKGKATLAPPRIRIPGNEEKPDKPPKITGTNNVPVLGSKWGSGSALATMSTALIATSATTSTPTEPPRLKRKRDPDFDDKVEGFKDYVKAWERAVRARFMVADAEAKRDRFFRTQKSSCYTRVSEAGRKMLDDQRAECDKEVTLQREKLSAAITSLIDFHDTITSNVDLGQRYNISEEAARFVSESKAFVDEVRALLVTRVLEAKNDVSSGDQHHPTPSSRGGDTLTLGSLRTQLDLLGDRLEEAQTELTLHHPRDIRSEVEEKLAMSISDLRAARQEQIERIASQPRPQIRIPPNALRTMEETAQRVKQLDEGVPHTVEDIRKLVLRVDALTQRVNRLEVECGVNKEIYSKIEEKAATIRETERRTDERLRKIQTKFERLTASQPDPSVQSLSNGLPERLLEDLRPAFDAALEKFYQREVQPTIQLLGKSVIETSDQHQQDAIRVLWGKIQPAMNAVAGVSRWLDSQELGLTAPVESTQAAAST